MRRATEEQAVRVLPAGPVQLAVAAPASKSMTNRTLLVAALARGTSVLSGPLSSDDTHAMRTAVTALGAEVVQDRNDWRIEGLDGNVAFSGPPIDARLSGTTMRFVTAAAALSAVPVTITGSAPLLRRPIGPLSHALRGLGATVEDVAGLPPVVVSGGLAGGAVTVDAAASSQFVSALLLPAPYARATVTVTADGAMAGAYVAMTVDLMRRWGARVELVDERRWRVEPGGYRGRCEAVEYDASAAAHLYSIAMATGGVVTVTNAAPATLQPDARIVDVLTAMGARVVQEGGSVRVHGPDTLSPISVDLAAMPDQVTTVAVLAALAPGVSHIRGVGVTRGHETDRLAALAVELRKLGVGVTEDPDGLTIQGGTARGPVRLETYDDHRLAMAFSVLGSRVEGVTVAEPGCVAKTFPDWWEVLSSAGVKITATS